ncbi:hypothetical protein ACI0FM_02940 [Paenochrobactrum sp. BZR 588]|uniref:hypothetical protein n=1 Tax=unclassified Paenochrobactrum TaxID=2639760 RepID=UPI0038525886
MSTFFTIIGLMFFAAIVWGICKGVAESNQHKEQGQALASIPDFRPVVQFNGASGGAGVAIDPANNKFAITSRANTRVFSFTDLVAVEVLKNGSSLTKTNRGSQVAGAAVGAVLLGPLGLLLGGVTGSKRNIEKVDRLSLKIFTNDLVTPVHEVVFFGGPQSKPDSLLVKQGAQQLDEWHGRFQTILHMRTNTTNNAAPIPAIEI